MTILEQILDILKDQELTSIEIAKELKIPKNNCASYLNTLLKQKKIERTNNKRPYKYKKSLTPIELLKQLYNLMDNKMKPVKPLDENEKEVIIEIEGLI